MEKPINFYEDNWKDLNVLTLIQVDEDLDKFSFVMRLFHHGRYFLIWNHIVLFIEFNIHQPYYIAFIIKINFKFDEEDQVFCSLPFLRVLYKSMLAGANN